MNYLLKIDLNLILCIYVEFLRWLISFHFKRINPLLCKIDLIDLIIDPEFGLHFGDLTIVLEALPIFVDSIGQ